MLKKKPESKVSAWKTADGRVTVAVGFDTAIFNISLSVEEARQLSDRIADCTVVE